MQRRQPAPFAMFVVAAVAFILCLGLAVYLSYLDYDNSRLKDAYDSSPSCKSPTQLSDCRFEGDATIARLYMDSKNRPALDVAMVQISGRTFAASLDKSYLSQWQRWRVGMSVTAELWKGSVVTKIAGIQTWDNPDTLPNAGALPGILFGGAALACAGVFVWMLSLNRRAARVAQKAAR